MTLKKQKPEPFPLNEKQKRYRQIANIIDWSMISFAVVLFAITLIFELKGSTFFKVMRWIWIFLSIPTKIATNILYEKIYPSR
ncbi:MAG: hypothetical protein GX802_00865 [Clostridiales bacterium]|jgi:uncharacterized membrane protein|nr:hypothetical protein [Clostridiales bacterium]